MDTLTDTQLAGRLDIGLWVGWSEAPLDRHALAVEHCRRAVDLSLATGRPSFRLGTETAQAWAMFRRGSLDEADRVLAGALERERPGPDLFLPVAAGLAGMVASCRGDDRARAPAERGSARMRPDDDPGLVPGMSRLFHVLALAARGQASQARDLLLAAGPGGSDLPVPRWGRPAAYEVLATVDVERNDLDAAQDWARRANEAARCGEVAGDAVIARRIEAVVLLAGGDPAGAAEAALDAAARADAARVPVEAGRSRILAGRALVRADQRARAVADLERASAELGRAGTAGYRVEAERELRRLGRRVPRRTSPATAAGIGLRTLTDRERELVAVVRRGCTNREIAAAVHSSEKTVERHLSVIYAKVGVSSRTALALLIAESEVRTFEGRNEGFPTG